MAGQKEKKSEGPRDECEGGGNAAANSSEKFETDLAGRSSNFLVENLIGILATDYKDEHR